MSSFRIPTPYGNSTPRPPSGKFPSYANDRCPNSIGSSSMYQKNSAINQILCCPSNVPMKDHLFHRKLLASHHTTNRSFIFQAPSERLLLVNCILQYTSLVQQHTRFPFVACLQPISLRLCTSLPPNVCTSGPLYAGVVRAYSPLENQALTTN